MLLDSIKGIVGVWEIVVSMWERLWEIVGNTNKGRISPTHKHSLPIAYLILCKITDSSTWVIGNCGNCGLWELPFRFPHPHSTLPRPSMKI